MRDKQTALHSIRFHRLNSFREAPGPKFDTASNLDSGRPHPGGIFAPLWSFVRKFRPRRSLYHQKELPKTCAVSIQMLGRRKEEEEALTADTRFSRKFTFESML